MEYDLTSKTNYFLNYDFSKGSLTTFERGNRRSWVVTITRYGKTKGLKTYSRKEKKRLLKTVEEIGDTTL